ncbi:hypothetical protein H6P81_015310 [Aristolochia fimbriata]|uniref:EF-hand domain-containing protein n=1 Tax=Aristolochia fimbriata TaxID=158543 RepID=A0AAV7E4Z2_ARIFI|nr:hypothetical protein H6P81_015310 [Aristolochia fimbriata]
MASSERSSAAAPMATTAAPRRQKVRLIFDRFDANADGGLDRSEMAALVAAVNPNVRFSAEQIASILDEVFRTYSDFVLHPGAGLSFDGLLQTYDDGAGDVDRDFEALGMPPPPAGSSRETDLDRRVSGGGARSWAVESPSPGIDYAATWTAVEDLELLIRRRIRACNRKKGVKDVAVGDGFSDTGWSTDLSAEFNRKMTFLDFTSSEFKIFLKELEGIRARVDSAPTRDERFDGHMGVGRTLYDHRLFSESLESFRRAAEIRPDDVRTHFKMGNALCSLGRLSEAKDCYFSALESAEMDAEGWATLLPQIHVNLGIALEGEGLLLNASEHYREAAILCPTHYRALKLLGSALFGVGEYGPAETALEEAILLKPDYADAHCDLGSVLHAIGERERAILEFQRVIDLKPDHLDALYNLGGLFMDDGRFGRAAEMYTRVLAIRPVHWRAQLNRAISLLGAGEGEEAKRALRDAFKMTKRVELYDAIAHVKHLQKKSKGRWNSMVKSEVGVDLEQPADVIVVETSKFKQDGKKGGTSVETLRDALPIRAFQRVSRLDRCDANLFKTELSRVDVPVSYSGIGGPEKSIRKSGLEVTLRKLLHFLKPEAFQEAVKAIDERVLSILDASGSGRIDLGMFCAAIAPVCAGPPEKRKRAAFDALVWRSVQGVQGQISRSDASVYLRYLSAVYFPSRRPREEEEEEEEEEGDDERAMISFPEFVDMFDNIDWGFGIMGALMKLENGDRLRQGGYSCDVCRYPIAGPRFKERKCGFNLCVGCYCEGKVPKTFRRDEYKFKEYWSSN